MNTSSGFNESEAAILQALVWERPVGDAATETLQTLHGRKLIRPSPEGWSVTYIGHLKYLEHRAMTFLLEQSVSTN